MVASSACADLGTRVEHDARLAYSFGHLDPCGPHGAGKLLRRMVGLFSVDLIDCGLGPGEVRVEFSRPSDDDRVRPTSAKLARCQRDEDMTMACARGCAHVVEWTFGQAWGRRRIDAVALAIVLPAAALGPGHASPSELAYDYVVDEALVHQRLRMLRGGHDSGERPALRIVGAPTPDVTDWRAAHRLRPVPPAR